MFGISGKVPIKKIKIYVDAKGQKKGDALVTFHRSDQAATACLQFDGLDIGDGYRIKVSKAKFTANNLTARLASSYDDMEIISLLPEPALAEKNPILIIRQKRDDEAVAFTSSIDELLVECCMHGEILALLPIVDSESSGMIIAAIAVFSSVDEAKACLAAVDARVLNDGCKYSGQIHIPLCMQPKECLSADLPEIAAVPVSTDEALKDKSNEAPENQPPTGLEEDDVDAFLNSLL